MYFKSSIAALFLAAPAWAGIEIHDPYARSSNAMAGAAFMVIANTTDEDDRLTGVTSQAAQRVELHTHIETDDGVMRMVHIEEGLDLPAGGEIVMQRGADHVMFMGLTSPFEQGQFVTLTLRFEKAGDVVVEVPVDQDRTGDHTRNHGPADTGTTDIGTADTGTADTGTVHTGTTGQDPMDHGSDG